MSNTLEVKSLKVTSIDAVKRAVQRLRAAGKQVTLEENTIARMWEGKHFVAPYVLKLAGKFDVALVNHKATANLPEHYTLQFDDWGGEVFKQLGNPIEGILHQNGHTRLNGAVKFTDEELALSNVNMFATTYTEEVILGELGSSYMINTETENNETVITLNKF